MKPPSIITTPLRWLYTAALWTAVFTGFGNMPVYKRYYVADLPGFGWAGDFFANLSVHYVAGAILCALVVYRVVAHGEYRPMGWRLTTSGKIRATLLVMTLLSGALVAAKNISSVNFPLEALLAVNLLHLTAAMFTAAVFTVCALARRPWLAPAEVSQGV